MQAAIDILEQAEDLSEDHTEVIRTYKQEVITAMKLFMLKYDEAKDIGKGELSKEIDDDEEFEILGGDEEKRNQEIAEELLKYHDI